MRRFIGNRRFTPLLSCLIALAIWWALTAIYPPLVVPTMSSVAAKLKEIVLSRDHQITLWLTAWRLLLGLAVGVLAGTAAGALLGSFPRLHEIFRPLVGLMQSVPPVSWLVLALIWFGFNGKASIFIVIVASFPIMTVNIVEGVRNVDVKLLQMARLYRFSWKKRLLHVILPSILPYFRAGLQVAMGIGSKTVVMGEVLTTSSGVGGEITNARLNIEPEGVVAWTIMIVAVYYLFNKLADLMLRGRRSGKHHADNSRSVQTLWGTGGVGASQPQG